MEDMYSIIARIRTAFASGELERDYEESSQSRIMAPTSDQGLSLSLSDPVSEDSSEALTELQLAGLGSESRKLFPGRLPLFNDSSKKSDVVLPDARNKKLLALLAAEAARFRNSQSFKRSVKKPWLEGPLTMKSVKYMSSVLPANSASSPASSSCILERVNKLSRLASEAVRYVKAKASDGHRAKESKSDRPSRKSSQQSEKPVPVESNTIPTQKPLSALKNPGESQSSYRPRQAANRSPVPIQHLLAATGIPNPLVTQSYLQDPRIRFNGVFYWALAHQLKLTKSGMTLAPEKCLPAPRYTRSLPRWHCRWRPHCIHADCAANRWPNYMEHSPWV